MKIVHAADLHLDSPFVGLGRLEGAPVEELRRATRRAFEGLIRLCLEERAALLLLAGDVFDGDWRDWNTGLFFVRELARLREVGTRVVLVKGNHDAASVLTRDLRMPENVRVLSSAAPETVRFDDLGVAVHGQSYPQKAVREDLASRYPAPVRDALNVGLLHTNAISSSEHDVYAPCTVAELRDRGYAYWALGHVHARAELHRDPWIVYPGNLQGRHARETGAKGATVVTVAEGRIADVSARELDVVRWAVVRAAPSRASSLHDVRDAVLDAIRGPLEAAAEEAAPRPLCARIVVDLGDTEMGGAHARLAPHLGDAGEDARAQVQALAHDLGEVWVERVVFERRPGRLQGEDLAEGGLARVLADEVAALGRDDAALAPYLEDLGGLRHALGTGSDVRLDAPDVRALLLEVEALLLGRLGVRVARAGDATEGAEHPRAAAPAGEAAA